MSAPLLYGFVGYVTLETRWYDGTDDKGESALPHCFITLSSVVYADMLFVVLQWNDIVFDFVTRHSRKSTCLRALRGRLFSELACKHIQENSLLKP